jgi:hypothetical protein
MLCLFNMAASWIHEARYSWKTANIGVKHQLINQSINQSWIHNGDKSKEMIIFWYSFNINFFSIFIWNQWISWPKTFWNILCLIPQTWDNSLTWENEEFFCSQILKTWLNPKGTWKVFIFFVRIMLANTSGHCLVKGIWIKSIFSAITNCLNQNSALITKWSISAPVSL